MLISRYVDFMNNLGERVGDAGQQFGFQAMNKLCQLRNDYPGKFLISPFGQGILNSTCPSPGSPPPPDTGFPFTGGQCDFEYNIFGYYRNKNVNFGADRAIRFWRSSRPLRGQIIGIANTSPNFGTPFEVVNSLGETTILEDNRATLVDDNRPYGFNTVSAPVAYDNEVFITRVVPVGGQEDVCGNIDQTDPPPVIPPDELFFDFVIVNDNRETVISGDITFNVNLPDLPDVIFNVGDNQFFFDFDGFNVSPPSAPAPPTFFPPSFDENNFTRNNRRPSGGGDGQPPDEPEELEQDEVVEDNIRYVIVNMIRSPIGGKSILLPNPEDSDFFAGYFAWIFQVNGEDYRTPSQPIRKKRNIFVPPNGANGYRIYAVNGATLSSAYYTLPVE